VAKHGDYTHLPLAGELECKRLLASPIKLVSTTCDTFRRMKCVFVLLAFIGFCCMPLGVAAQQQPSSIEKEHLLDGQFKMISKTEDIPTTVKQAFSKITRQPPFAMANPGQKFQVTDYVVDGTLPWRRLAFAGVQDDKWFVHYERGGYAHSYYVVEFRADPHGDAHFVWGCYVTGVAKALEQLRKMVANCQLSNAESYW
jgi:hypothetical protein